MQRERRRDPYRWTWEIPLGIAIAVLLIIVAGIQLGRSMANLGAGAGWTWPTPGTGTASASASAPGSLRSPLGSAFWSSLPGVLTGHADAGLSPAPPANDLAAPEALWACLVATELLLLAGCVWVGIRGYQRWGPRPMRGMATAAEAETLLGITRLRKVANYVRPDLHGRPAAPPSAGTSASPSATLSGPGGRSAVGHEADSNIGVRHGMSPWLLPGRRTPSRDSKR